MKHLPFAIKIALGVGVLVLTVIGLNPGRVLLPSPHHETSELQRIEHQTITVQQAYFTVKSQPERSRTAVSFFYIAGEHESDSLSLKTTSGYLPICLITSPLLASSHLNSISSGSLRLYTDNADTTFDTYRSHPLVADQAAARIANLAPNSYKPLETTHSLQPSDTVLTTYNPPTKDGSWSYASCTVDASTAEVSADNQLQWLIVRRDTSAPLQLGAVHVNYRLDAH